MKVIGLCGGSGSGKGTVGKLLSELGIPTIDTDLVYRELTSYPSDCLKALAAEFGNEIVADDGSLDRVKLRGLVFFGEGSEGRRMRLNEISHAYILAKTRSMLSEYEDRGFNAVTIDAPLLYESGFDKECDAVIAVLADRDVRIGRIIARDGITRDAAERRIDSQIPDDELKRRADFIIVNDGDEVALYKSVSEIALKIQNF